MTEPERDGVGAGSDRGPTDGTAAKAAAGALWTAIGNWGHQLLTLVVFTLLARLLEPSDFGLVAFASVFLALVKVFAEQGMADAVVQRDELDDVHLDTAFWTSAGGGLVLAGLLAGGSGLIATVVGRPDVAPVLAGLSVSIAIAGLGNVQRGVLTRALDFRGLAMRVFASAIGGGIVGVAMALSGFGVWSLVGQTIAFEAFGVATLWASSPWRPGFRFDRGAFVELSRFGVGVVGYKTLVFLNTRSDNFVIGLYLGSEALGFYVIAYRLLQLLLNVTTAIIGTVAFPLLSRVQRDRDAVASRYYRVVRTTALLAFPAFVGAAVVAPELVRAVFGPNWDASVPVVRALAVGGLVQSVLLVNSVVIKALGRPGWRVWVMGLTSGLNIVAFVVAVRWGIVGVAIAFASVTIAVAPVWWVTARRLVALRLGAALRELVTPMLAAAAMAAAVVAARAVTGSLGPVLALGVLVPIGVVTYAAALRLVDRRLYAEAVGLAAGAVRTVTGRGVRRR